jgi:3-deoxy-D-manno-octulosonic-acid transferase
MVTYFSPSAEVPVAAFPGIDFAAPAPWDKPRPLAQMIARARPRALLIARTDAWPEMVEQARIAGVPSLLFSATLTSSSGRSAAWARPAALLSLDPLAQIFCVGESDREAFAKLGYAAKTRVAGDTRYDQVLARLASPKPIRDELFKAQQPTLIAGSTWPEDERELFVAAQALRGRVRFCLVPHEPTPDRMRQLQALASAAGFASALYSEASDWPDGAVLLVDRVGVLAELYAKGRFAFVGGSFRKTVHSVMEPLASGARTFIGPLYANNREAAEFQGVIAAGLPAVRACASGADLAGAVGDAMGASEAESRAAIRGAVQARAGQGTGAVLEWIRRAIEQRRSLP